MYYFYWLPIGTDAKVRGTPWITWLIVIANVAVFAALHSLPGAEATAYRLAFKAGQPTVPTAIASIFLHASPIQLLVNMAFLACFGPPLETRLGPTRYLIGFIACGWLANLARAAWIALAAPDMGTLPIIGAAGAISGLMGLFLVRASFARLRFASMRMLLSRGVFRADRRTLPAIVAICVWFLVQVWASLGDSVPEASLAGHLGGLLIGMLFGWSMGLIPEGKLESHPAAARRFAAKGEWFEALCEYDAYLAAAPDDPEVLAETARVERVTHHDELAVDHFQRAIHIWLQQRRFREACDTFEEMKRLLGAVSLPPGDLLRMARACEVLGRPGDASRAYEAFGRSYPEREGATAALLKSAEIELVALKNGARARYLYDELLRRPLPPDIERVVRERAGVTEAQAPQEETVA